ncbi:NEDD4-binding protein 2-like 2 [Chanos chanos]|uniref:NEDD4-binding protein 2-like 2 n=1 Tax=Chanos chanos TaxID=29144 RepID=A0A6J2VQG6_CHACN|nr:NEDD4-binding protein 2-like 2 [Chanos chanos]
MATGHTMYLTHMLELGVSCGTLESGDLTHTLVCPGMALTRITSRASGRTPHLLGFPRTFLTTGPDSTATGGYSDFDGHPGYRVEFPSYDTPHWSQPYNQQQSDSQRDSWQQYDSGQDSWQQYDSGQDSWQHYDSGQDSRQHYDSGQDSRQQYHGEEDQGHHENGASLKLILMRGAPGCGKSTLAKELLSTGPNGIILSTDDYFFQDGEYFFDPTLLGEAHGWNQNRAWKAIQEYRSPVIIDNTNIQAWEMKPYVVMALEKGYCITFHEPDTSWKFDPSQLERRNKHGVSREKIVKILESFERPMTVNIVLNSTEPPRRNKRHLSKNSI